MVGICSKLAFSWGNPQKSVSDGLLWVNSVSAEKLSSRAKGGISQSSCWYSPEIERSLGILQWRISLVQFPFWPLILTSVPCFPESNVVPLIFLWKISSSLWEQESGPSPDSVGLMVGIGSLKLLLLDLNQHPSF